MICAVHQPQYLPWLGFFSKLDAADLFVIYDDTQYKHDEWQNRNRIKTANGVQWLTVPVHRSQGEIIRDIRIDNAKPWARKHANALTTNYARAPFYKEHADEFAAALTQEWEHLAELNIAMMKHLCRMLGVETPMVLSSQLGYNGKATDALISICRSVEADAYLSGPGGRDYLETEKFGAAGISLLFHDFDHPAYAQLFGEFVPNLSAVDLLFNSGPDGLAILRSGQNVSEPLPHREPKETV